MATSGRPSTHWAVHRKASRPGQCWSRATAGACCPNCPASIPPGRWQARSIGRRAASVRSGAEIAIGREIAERLELGLGDRLRVGRANLPGIGHHQQGARGLRFCTGAAIRDGRGGIDHERPDPAGQHQQHRLSNHPASRDRCRIRRQGIPAPVSRRRVAIDRARGSRRRNAPLHRPAGPDAAAGGLVGPGNRRSRHVQRGGRFCRLAPAVDRHSEACRRNPPDGRFNVARRNRPDIGYRDPRGTRGRRRRARRWSANSPKACFRSPPIPARSGWRWPKRRYSVS